MFVLAVLLPSEDATETVHTLSHHKTATAMPEGSCLVVNFLYACMFWKPYIVGIQSEERITSVGGAEGKKGFSELLRMTLLSLRCRESRGKAGKACAFYNAKSGRLM